MSDDEVLILDGPPVAAAAAAAAPGAAMAEAVVVAGPAAPPSPGPEDAGDAELARTESVPSPRTPERPEPPLAPVFSAGAPTSMESDEFRKSAAGPAEDDGVDDVRRRSRISRFRVLLLLFFLFFLSFLLALGRHWTLWLMWCRGKRAPSVSSRGPTLGSTASWRSSAATSTESSKKGYSMSVALSSGDKCSRAARCIEKWLKGKGERCPQCNARAKPADLRIIFAKVDVYFACCLECLKRWCTPLSMEWSHCRVFAQRSRLRALSHSLSLSRPSSHSSWRAEP
jgi:hypothetical protein